MKYASITVNGKVYTSMVINGKEYLEPVVFRKIEIVSPNSFCYSQLRVLIKVGQTVIAKVTNIATPARGKISSINDDGHIILDNGSEVIFSPATSTWSYVKSGVNLPFDSILFDGTLEPPLTLRSNDAITMADLAAKLTVGGKVDAYVVPGALDGRSCATYNVTLQPVHHNPDGTISITLSNFMNIFKEPNHNKWVLTSGDFYQIVQIDFWDIRKEIKYSATSTTAPADIVAWFNANGQTISTTVNENTFTANFKIIANLADGTTKTFNSIGAYFNSDPHTFYPTAAFTNSQELISHPATVWGSSGKWTYFPAGSGSPNDAGRTGIAINSFEIIKI